MQTRTTATMILQKKFYQKCVPNYWCICWHSTAPNGTNKKTGTDVMIKKTFAKKFGKNLEFFTQSKPKLCKILIITLVFEKNTIFFAENRRKSWS
jgi:hypothetical protein